MEIKDKIKRYWWIFLPVLPILMRGLWLIYRYLKAKDSTNEMVGELTITQEIKK